MDKKTESQKLIKENSNVLLVDNQGNSKLARIEPKGRTKLFRSRILHATLVGKPFNSVYDISETEAKYVGPITAKTYQSLTEDIIGTAPEPTKASNKELFDTNTAQQLTAEKISELQTGGVVGKDLVAELVENSATFDKKTTYSQEKYIKKKEKKHIKKFFLFSPSAQLLCQYYLEHEPGKTGALRFDTLALMLHVGDVQPGATVMISENLSGLVLAAAAERMNGEGTITYAYTDGKMDIEILSKLNMTSAQKKNIVYNNVKYLLEREESGKAKNPLVEAVLKEQEGNSQRQVLHNNNPLLV